MINKILIGIVSFITSIISFILTPILNLINSAFPFLGDIQNFVINFFTSAFSYVGWVLDSLFISSETISLLITFLITKVTLSITTSLIKLAIKWYNALKP